MKLSRVLSCGCKRVINLKQISEIGVQRLKGVQREWGHSVLQCNRGDNLNVIWRSGQQIHPHEYVSKCTAFLCMSSKITTQYATQYATQKHTTKIDKQIPDEEDHNE
jgi:hypothetical protein